VLSSLIITLALGLRPVPLPPPPFAAFPALEAPAIAARSWMVYSVNQEAIVGFKDPDLPMPPASITKLMTSMLAEESLDLTGTITISANADNTPIGFAGQPDVRQGEVWPAWDLLANVMVQSGNDASTAIAEAVSGNVEDFVALMNARAAELGMTGTTFNNPHGLDSAGHVTTARDLITMGRDALNHPITMHLARTKRVTFQIGVLRVFSVEATDRDLGVFPGLLGLKTGDTANAGQVLLSYTVTQHDRIIAVVLGTPDRRATTRSLVAWAMTTLGARDHFYGLAAGSDVVLGFPEWYQTRITAAATLDHGTPVAPSRTPLTDDLEARFREILPQLLGGDP
jgi:D-alanyl-D-alanine carboxypeptidase (penicillin-binding protein 5/6)